MFTKPNIYERFLNNCTCCRKKGKSKLKENENVQGGSLDNPYKMSYEKRNKNNKLRHDTINMSKLWEEIKEVKTRLQYLEKVYTSCENPSKSYSCNSFKNVNSLEINTFVSPIITNGGETDFTDVMLKDVECNQADISAVESSKPHTEIEDVLKYQRMDNNPESCPVDDKVFYSKRTSDLKIWFPQDEYLVIYRPKNTFSQLNYFELNNEFTWNPQEELVVLYSPKNSLTKFSTEEITAGSTLLPQYESLINNSKQENNSKLNSHVISYRSTEFSNNQPKVIYEQQNNLLQHSSHESSEGSTEEGDICLDDDDLVTEYSSSHHQVRVVPTRKFSEKIDKWHQIKKLRSMGKKNDCFNFG